MENRINVPVLNALLGDVFGQVRRIAQTGSTNADLMAAPMSGKPARPNLLWADHQNAGRGRRGRIWLDQPGGSLTFSVALEHASDQPMLTPVSAFTLVAGVIVISVLRDQIPGLSGSLSLKWPNDVLITAGKVGGILTEVRTEAGINRVVIGCGLNLRVPAGLKPEKDALPAAGLLAEGPGARDDHDWNDARSERLVGQVALGLRNAFDCFSREGFDAFREQWQALNGFAGKQVTLSHNGEELVSGVCSGVDRAGALCIESNGIITAHAIGVLSARATGGIGAYK